MAFGESRIKRPEIKKPEPLSFESERLFKLDRGQLDRLEVSVRNAMAALQTDEAATPDGLNKLALTSGIRNETRYYDSGVEPAYSGEVKLSINGRPYKAVGLGPVYTAGYQLPDQVGGILFTPQNVPPGLETRSLSAEQEALYKMSMGTLDLVLSKIHLAKKLLDSDCVINCLNELELRMLAFAFGIEQVFLFDGHAAATGIIPNEGGTIIARGYSGSAQITINNKVYRVEGHPYQVIDGPVKRYVGGNISWELEADPRSIS